MSSRPRPFKLIVLVLLLIATGVLGFAFSPRPIRANPATFTLYGRVVSPSGWGSTASTVSSPGPDLTVMPGETVTLSLNSADGYTHTWGVDYNRDNSVDPGEPLSSSFSTSTSFTFTATTMSGTYTYWCNIHYGLMHGKFIVQSPPAPDFSISASPTTVGPLSMGVQGTSTITISPMNGFTGTVMLSTAPSSGLTATVSPTSISGGSGTSILTTSASAAGTYNVNVTGTSGSLSHMVKVTVYVGADFTITSSQPSLSINQGSSSTYTLTLQSLNGFSGSVGLAATVTSGGPSATLNPPTVTLSPGTSGQSTVQVSTSSGIYSSTSTGIYTLNVTGTSSSISHSTTVTITVTSGTSSGTGSIPTSVIVGVVIVIVAATVVAVLAVRRVRPKK